MITADTLRACRFTEISHGHGPGMFVYVYLCTEHPRLQIKDVGQKSTRSITRTWLVDGKEVSDEPAAVAALNIPVVITPEEQAILDTLPADWTDAPAGTRGDLVERTFGLRCKGLVEWQRGQYRRTPQP